MFKTIIRAAKMDFYRSTYALRKSKGNIQNDVKSYKLLLEQGSKLIHEYEKKSLSEQERIKKWEEIKSLDNFETNKRLAYSVLGLFQAFMIVSVMLMIYDIYKGANAISLVLQVLFIFFGIAVTANQNFFCICDKKNTLIDKKTFFLSVIPYLFINYVDGMVYLFDLIMRVIKSGIEIISKPSVMVGYMLHFLRSFAGFLVSFFTFKSDYMKEMDKLKEEMKYADISRKAKRKKRNRDEDDSE